MSLVLLFSLFGCSEDMSSNSEFEAEIEEAIREFENRRIYSELNQSVIAEIEDDKLEQAVLDLIYGKIGDNFEHAFEIVTQLPSVYSVVYSTWWVEAEVFNGGFNQYFWNSSGEFADVAIAGYEALGASDCARIVEMAIQTALKEMPEMEKFRKKGTLDAFSRSYEVSSLNKLDSEFYDCSQDMSEQRVKFIRRYSNEFSTE